MMVRGQWGNLGFLMTTESQDLGLMSHPKDGRKYFRFHNETHSVSTTWRRQQQYYSENKSYAFFHCLYVWAVFIPHRDVDMWGCVWMSRFRRAWQILNFYKEYLFGFETLIFATLQMLYIHKQLVTIQRQRKTWNRIIWPLLFIWCFVLSEGKQTDLLPRPEIVSF